jgi:hypothetical protein
MNLFVDGDQGSRSQMVGNLEELRARGQAVIESLSAIQTGDPARSPEAPLRPERPPAEGLPLPFPGPRRPLPGVGLPGDGSGQDHRHPTAEHQREAMARYDAALRASDRRERVQ